MLRAASVKSIPDDCAPTNCEDLLRLEERNREDKDKDKNMCKNKPTYAYRSINIADCSKREMLFITIFINAFFFSFVNRNPLSLSLSLSLFLLVVYGNKDS
jgi:hypothetical protein